MAISCKDYVGFAQILAGQAKYLNIPQSYIVFCGNKASTLQWSPTFYQNLIKIKDIGELIQQWTTRKVCTADTFFKFIFIYLFY